MNPTLEGFILQFNYYASATSLVFHHPSHQLLGISIPLNQKVDQIVAVQSWSFGTLSRTMRRGFDVSLAIQYAGLLLSSPRTNWCGDLGTNYQTRFQDPALVFWRLSAFSSGVEQLVHIALPIPNKVRTKVSNALQ